MESQNFKSNKHASRAKTIQIEKFNAIRIPKMNMVKLSKSIKFNSNPFQFSSIQTFKWRTNKRAGKFNKFMKDRACKHHFKLKAGGNCTTQSAHP